VKRLRSVQNTAHRLVHSIARQKRNSTVRLMSCTPASWIHPADADADCSHGRTAPVDIWEQRHGYISTQGWQS